MKQERQLKRRINGNIFYCEALRGTKEDANKTKKIQRDCGHLVRIYPVTTEGIRMYGVFVSPQI